MGGSRILSLIYTARKKSCNNGKTRAHLCLVSWAGSQAHVRVLLIPRQIKMQQLYGQISTCSSTSSTQRSTYSGQRWFLRGLRKSPSVQTSFRTLLRQSDCVYVPRCGEDHSLV